jgi:hypothetical protein
MKNNQKVFEKKNNKKILISGFAQLFTEPNQYPRNARDANRPRNPQRRPSIPRNPRPAAYPRARRGIRNRSLSPEQFNRIGRPSAAEIRGGVCVICLGELNSNQLLRKLVCNHIFHEECLFGWIGRQEATCPICRRNVINNY